MEQTANHLLDFTQTLGLVLILIVAYAAVFPILQHMNRFVSRVVTGAMFAIVAVAGMMLSVEIMPGVEIDVRTVLVGLAAAIGGPLAGVAAAIPVCLVRWQIGGVGAIAGIGAIVTAAGVGSVFHARYRNRVFQVRTVGYAMLGVALAVAGLAWIVVLPPDDWADALARMWITVAIGYPVSTVLIFEILRLAVRMREGEWTLRGLMTVIPDVMIILTADGRFVDVFTSDKDLLYATAREVENRTLEEVFRPEQAARYRDVIDRTIRTQSLQSIDYPLRTGGRERWFSARVVPLETKQGPGVLWLARDITDRKRLEDRQRRMMLELDHRVKNTLAAVISMSDSAIRASADLDEFRHRFQPMIRSMVRTHEALASRQWDSLPLRDIVTRAFEACPQATTDRYEIVGPNVDLDVRIAQPLALAMHEIATNAMKHGAMQSERGRVHVSWTADQDTLNLEWSEHGGPPVMPPDRPGTGTALLQGLIEYEIGGTIETTYAPAGIVCRITLPLHADDDVPDTDGVYDFVV